MNSKSNVCFPTTAPLEYHASVNQYVEDNLSKKEVASNYISNLELLLDSRWENITGLKPEESEFLLTIPIRNSERTISETLQSLMLSLLPNKVNCKTLMVLNDSTDNSLQIILDFFANLGEVTPVSIQGLTGYSVRIGNKEFIVLSTEEAGKPNALNFANNYAIQNNIRVCMNLDSDVFPGPEAIAQLFSNCYKTYYNEDKFPVQSAKYVSDMKPGTFTTILKKLTGKSQKHITGSFFGWNPQYIESIGGIPATKIEDYSLSKVLEYESTGFDIVETSEVFIYLSNNPLQWLNIYKRYSIGLLQFLENYGQKYPNLKETIAEDFEFLKTSQVLIEDVKNTIKIGKFSELIKYIVILVQKIIHIAAKYEYEVDPENTGWTNL